MNIVELRTLLDVLNDAQITGVDIILDKMNGNDFAFDWTIRVLPYAVGQNSFRQPLPKIQTEFAFCAILYCFEQLSAVNKDTMGRRIVDLLTDKMKDYDGPDDQQLDFTSM